MASKKVNPQALAQLAKQKTASAAQFRKAEEADKKRVKASKPSTTDTTPPSPPTTIDPEWEAIFGTPTTSVPTTTTTVPSIPTTPTTAVSTTTTTVPRVVGPTTTTTVPLSQRLSEDIMRYENALTRNLSEREIAKVKSGETKPKGKSLWSKAWGGVTNTAGLITEQAFLPLKVWGYVSRVVPSAFEETGQGFRGAQRYEATNYIPTHKQTGKPIAKPGDAVIINWEEIANTPIDKKLRHID